MINDPTQLTVNDVVTPIVQQAVSAATAEVQGRLAALEQQIADAATKAAPQVEYSLVQGATAILHDVETDTTTQRVLVWGIAGAVLIAALAILGFALLGNSTALKWIGAAPAAAVGLVLWLSNSGVSLPKPTVKSNA